MSLACGAASSRCDDEDKSQISMGKHGSPHQTLLPSGVLSRPCACHRALPRIQAFMSTTTDRAVAMGYANASGGRTAGIVIECQQGMVNRGADISWLSQYPHEREILVRVPSIATLDPLFVARRNRAFGDLLSRLRMASPYLLVPSPAFESLLTPLNGLSSQFGPLTSIEVLRTRIDGSAVIIESAFSINLTALTLEQVLGKRRKVVSDMCEQLALKARRAANGDVWAFLRSMSLDAVPSSRPLPVLQLPTSRKLSGPARPSGSRAESFGAQSAAAALAPVLAAVERFLAAKLHPIAAKESTHYNENGPLGEAIQEAVATADMLEQWPVALPALAEALETSIEKLVLELPPEGVVLPKDCEVGPQLACALAALMWINVGHSPLTIYLSGCEASPEAVVTLARGTRAASLTKLHLEKSDFTADGKDLSGLRYLRAALCDPASSLTELHLAGNRLVPLIAASSNQAPPTSAPAELVDILHQSPNLTKLGLISTGLSRSAAAEIAALASGRRIMLTGLAHDATVAEFDGHNGSDDRALQGGDGVLIAADLRLNSSLRRLKLAESDLGNAGHVKVSDLRESSGPLRKGDQVHDKRTGRQLVVKRPPSPDDLLQVEIFDDSAVIPLADAVRAATNLTDVVLDNNRLSPMAIAYVADAILANTSIETFNDVPLKELRRDSLETLDLKKKLIGDEGALVLSRLLPTTKKLCYLSLAFNSPEEGAITRVGGEPLAEAILQTSTLSTLTGGIDLDTLRKHEDDKVVVETEGLGATESFLVSKLLLSKHCSIVTLNLDDNEVGIHGLIAIAGALKVNASLQSLSLDKNQLTNVDDNGESFVNWTAEALEELVEALRVCRSLRALSLRANNLGPRGIEVLAPGLAANRSLTSMDVGQNEWCTDIEVKPSTLTVIEKVDKVKTTSATIEVGTAVLYLRTRECNVDDNASTIGTSVPALVVDAVDRDGDQKIVLLSGAHALAEVVRSNTRLEELTCASSLPNLCGMPHISLTS